MVKLIILASSKFSSLSIKVLISETNKVSLCLPWAIDKLQTNEKIVKQKRNVIFLIQILADFLANGVKYFDVKQTRWQRPKASQTLHRLTDWHPKSGCSITQTSFGVDIVLNQRELLKAAHEHSMIHWPQLCFHVLNLIRLKLTRISKLYLSSEFS